MAGNAPPRVVAVSPEDGATDVEPTGTITLEFSEELDEATVTQDSVRVLDGDAIVEGELSYERGKVTFTPRERLPLLAELRVEVTSAVTDVEGAELLEELSAGFTVRDGAWSTIDVAKGDLYQLSEALPMAQDGSVLLAWSGQAQEQCPTRAAWFEPGANMGASKVFTDVSGYSCAALQTATNSDGVGAVSWAADSSHYVQQYRAGAWAASSYAVPSTDNPYVYGVAVGPDGVVTRFQSIKGGQGFTAVRTSPAGDWVASTDALSTTLSGSAPHVAFDRNGDGVAVWHAADANDRPRVAMSRYSAASRKWSAAEAVPGSIASTASFVEIGYPTVALAPDGQGMAVWRKGQGDVSLMASYYSPQTGWGPAELVSAGTTVAFAADRPGLTFDGSRFVAAWVGSNADGSQMFTSTYEPQSGWAMAVGHDAQQPLPFPEMPRVVSDGRGALLLVWKTGTAPNYALVFRRFVAGEWGRIAVVPGGSIADKQTQGAPKAPVVMNDRGLAAISWANRDLETSRITAIRLARFQ